MNATTGDSVLFYQALDKKWDNLPPRCEVDNNQKFRTLCHFENMYDNLDVEADGAKVSQGQQ